LHENHLLIPVAQWRQTQKRAGQAAFADVLAVDRLYEIDGGVFQAQQAEDGRWELWTWMGKAGRAVARTGFEVDAEGLLYDRIYDVTDGEMLVLVPARFAVADLQPVSAELCQLMMEELERLRGRAVG
jgi:hypothetical protein